MACQSNDSDRSRYIITRATLFVTALILMSQCQSVSEAIMVKGKEPSSFSNLTLMPPANSVNLDYYGVKNKSMKDIALLANVSVLNNKEKQISSITYTVKFECGVISEDAGMLTPGYYDTDLSILNKQGYPITVLLNVIVNNSNQSSNSIIKTLQPQESTGISCKDILSIFNIKGQEIVEGFMIILVPLDNGVLNSLANSGAINTAPLQLHPLPDQINLLDVRLFYSVNSFASSPPQNQIVSKIDFSILNDVSGKIPHPMLLKTLYVTLQSQTNTIFEPNIEVKRILADKYNLSKSEETNLKVKIYDVDTIPTTLLDRHAISSLQIQPQTNYQ
ncbi:MAG: hypothetical protein JO297_08760 [Nitrososphaeraceae archaeon]|nr:hypothetical protein [Nitrososphaeraceae archaeon]